MRIAFFIVLVACEPRHRTHDDAARASDASVDNGAIDTAIDTAIDAAPAHPFVLLPCGSTVLGRPFRGAAILCIAFQAASITSLAIDDPARRVDARIALATLVEHALAPPARRGFPRSSVLYRGLVALVFAGLAALFRYGQTARSWR